MFQERIRVVLSVVFVGCLFPLALGAAAQPSVDQTVFSGADAKAETILHIAALGRYSLSAQSARATTLELVDRMAGTIGNAGPSGSDSGASGSLTRLDLFLEPGDYKVRMTRQPGDTVTLGARRFPAVNAGADETEAPVLADGQTASAELRDTQLFSYWLRIDAANPSLILEVQGRSLRDVALWKDGTWDRPTAQARRTLERERGRPVRVFEFNTVVEPGDYLLVCAGGPRLPWAKESEAEPFFVRRGVRYLGDLGVMNVTIGEQGTESFLLSGRVRFVEMQTHNTNGYRLLVGRNGQETSRYDALQQASIDEKSKSLRCSVGGGGGSATSWLTVQGPPGETVELRWLGADRSYSAYGTSALQPYTQAGDYLTSVLSAAEGSDSIDQTGMIVEARRSRQQTNLEIRESQPLLLSTDSLLRRRLNLITPLNILLQPRAGVYAVMEKESSAASAVYLFRLFDDVDQAGAQEVEPGNRIELEEKLYLVTIQPVKAGILDFAIVGADLLDKGKTGDMFSGPAPEPRNDIFWASTRVEASPSSQNVLILAGRGSIPVGVQVRRLPLDIEDPACVRVDPAAVLSLAFVNRRPVVLFSTNPEFSPATADIDGQPWRPGQPLPPGAHTLSLANHGSAPQWHVIGGVAPDTSALTPRPVVPDPEAVFPQFSEDAPAWRDFGRGETASFLLKVKEPASYRISTEGRLAMGVRIRTFLRSSLLSVAQNADGRNAAVTAYLRPGIYLVLASAQGASKGRAGIAMRRLDIVKAGSLSAGGTLRATVPAGAVMAADLAVRRASDYELQCLGLGRSFSYRLEDEDGWPVGAVVQSGTATVRLDSRLYRYISLADTVQTRRLLAMREIVSAPFHDPRAKLLAMALNQTYRKVWMEEPGRPEDVLTVELPADIQASFSVSKGMAFRILNPSGSQAYQGTGGKPFPLGMTRGKWQIAVSSVEEDNRRAYEVSLSTEDFTIGTSRRISGAPGLIPVSIGSAGTAEIWSFGGDELDASLLDEAGNLVARAETIPDDWNFRIVASVKPGRYKLFYFSPLAAQSPVPQASRAEPEAREDQYGEEGDYPEGEYQDEEGGVAEPAPVSPPVRFATTPASSDIRMVVRDEKVLPAATGSLETSVEAANEVMVVRFTAREAGLYRFSGRTGGTVSVAVLRDGRLLASGPSPLFLPLTAKGQYTMRFWRTTDQPSTVTLRAAPEPSADAAPGTVQDVKRSALKLAFPAGASFRLEAGAGPLLFSGGTELPFQPLTDAAVSTAAGTGWAVRQDGEPLGPCRSTPVSLADGAAVPVTVGAIEGGFALKVPARTAALVRTENVGRPVGLSASAPDSPRPKLFDWKGSLVGLRASVIGLRSGAYKGRLWETAPTGSGGIADAAVGGAPARRVAVSAELFPVVKESALGSSDRTIQVPPRSAVAFTAAKGQAARVSLEKGMAAFAWTGGPSGAVDAPDDAATGTLEPAGGSLVVVNRNREPALCTVRPVAASAVVSLGEGAGFEGAAAAGGVVSLAVRPSKPASLLYLWGQPLSVRFLSEGDGRIYAGEKVPGELAGVLRFPAGRGRLEVQASGGPLKVWLARPDSFRAVFAGRDPKAKRTALPPEGGQLAQTGQSWGFSLDAPSIVCVRAGGDGVSGLFDAAGSCLRTTAGTGGRTLLASLPKGSYTLFTRPLAGTAGQSGLVRISRLTPVELAADGPGEPALIGPLDMALYRFRLQEGGKMGCGIRVQSDGLAASLYSERFALLGTGMIFVRTLKAGQYYLLVSSSGDTQRFVPLVYGLAGNRSEIPDDVIRSYRRE